MSSKGAAEADATNNISKVGTASVENNIEEHTCKTNNANSENNSSAPTETAETRVNWLDALPREALNNIHLPPAIVFHDGLLCSDITDILSLGLDSPEQSSEEMKATRDSRHLVLEFTSNTSMLAKLDRLPANSLASYTNLTITVKGSYNGHAVLYSNFDDCHRTNISPILRREGDKVWFEVVYPCIDCKNKPFYQRELEFACPTILAKFERLTGLTFAAGAVGINTHIHKDGRNVPHVLAYKLAEIWQPWKHIRRLEMDNDYRQDSLDILYSDNDPDNDPDHDGLRYGGFDKPHGLGVQGRDSEEYLILY